MFNRLHPPTSTALVKSTATPVTAPASRHDAPQNQDNQAACETEKKSRRWKSIVAQQLVPAIGEIETASIRLARATAELSIAAAGDVLWHVGTACLNAGEYCRDKQSQR